MIKISKNKKGFTLIELLVVITIIGILSTLIIRGINKSRTQAIDKRMQQMLHNLQVKLELYHLEHGEYPAGQYASFYNPEDQATQQVSLESLASTLGLNEDSNNMYPCGEYNPECESYFLYQSYEYPETRSCWKNHYLIFYSIQNPTTPFQPIEDYPCGANGMFGDNPLPSFCTDSIHEEWEDWFCDDGGKDFTLIMK